MQLLDQSLELAREVGDRQTLAFALLNLGQTARFQGDSARARPILETSLRLYRELGDLRWTAMTITMPAYAVLEQGDHERAAELFLEGLAVHQAVGDRALAVQGLRGLAGVALGRGQSVRAASWLGAAEALRDALGIGSETGGLTHTEKVRAAVRAELSESDFAAALAAGRSLSPQQVVAEARAAGRSAGPAGHPPLAVRDGASREPLTPRERQVARLLGRGYTDREIADALTIAVSMVGVHVHHILAKLGLRSRWQIADWAVEHGLLERVPAEQ